MVLGVIRKVLSSDYVALAKFLVPLAFTDIAIDIGEQVLKKRKGLHEH